MYVYTLNITLRTHKIKLYTRTLMSIEGYLIQFVSFMLVSKVPKTINKD